jgi:ethanolamine-phosphate phospho-lyase
LKQGLEKIQKKFPVIGNIRGMGFFLGVEFVKNSTTREPHPTFTREMCEGLKTKYKILTGVDGPNLNVIKIKPPMCFSAENAEFFLKSWEELMGEVSKSNQNGGKA